jgi:IPTL-CTERM motif
MRFNGWRSAFAEMIRVLVAGVASVGLFALPSTARAQTPPDVTIAITHIGNFTVGMPGVYTMVLSNVGTAAIEPSHVNDAFTGLPFTFVSAVGADGWQCNFLENAPTDGPTVYCLSMKFLQPGASASPITLTVIPTASGTWTNTVHGGGCYPNLCTDKVASDITVVVAAVPTLPEWAMMALTVLLAVAGFAALRRRTGPAPL